MCWRHPNLMDDWVVGLSAAIDSNYTRYLLSIIVIRYQPGWHNADDPKLPFSQKCDLSFIYDGAWKNVNFTQYALIKKQHKIIITAWLSIYWPQSCKWPQSCIWPQPSVWSQLSICLNLAYAPQSNIYGPQPRLFGLNNLASMDLRMSGLLFHTQYTK